MTKSETAPGNNIIIQHFTVGPLETNCYLVADNGTKEACLIDPGADGGKLRRSLKEQGLKLKFVINTHGHGDHIAANGSFNVPIYIHKLDKDFLSDPVKNMSRSFLLDIKSPPAARLLSDGDMIELGDLRFKVIHTPGHTPGSISLKLDGVIFTGDALFKSGIGRTDFSYGDEELLVKSIRKRLFIYDDDTKVYPGHGEATTIGVEKRENPFV
jgi:glyoxylase-like metal-dependent hydrolase (beta-lactamase superfamily II)